MKKILFSAGAAFLLSVGFARAADLPEAKEGLWSSHTQTVDQPGNKKSEATKTICRNHAYDQYVKELAAKVPGCTKVSENYNGRTLTTEMRCVVGGSVIDGKGTSVFQGDTAVHSETHSTYTAAMYGVSETTMIMDQKYVGSCPAGSQPEDMRGEDGKLFNTWKH